MKICVYFCDGTESFSLYGSLERVREKDEEKLRDVGRVKREVCVCVCFCPALVG